MDAMWNHIFRQRNNLNGIHFCIGSMEFSSVDRLRKYDAVNLVIFVSFLKLVQSVNSFDSMF